MNASLLELIVDPESLAPFVLDVASAAGDEVLEGALRDSAGRSYPVRAGIPRLVPAEGDSGQAQTADSFGFKWQKRDSYSSDAFSDVYGRWIVGKHGFASREDMRRYFGAKGRVLDAGCGAGLATSVWLDDSWRGRDDATFVGIDISSAIDVAKERLGRIPGTHFVQADIMRLPFRPGTFDAIISEGVLHHTPSTEAALGALARLLAPGGELLFYVYRKKGPVREFTDDYVRGVVADQPPEKVWEMLRPLTLLGKALSDLHATVTVPEDIPFLGIKAGEHDVQRLIYWNFVKLFWNDRFSVDENVHLNFDWFHPRYAHRQTEEDVRLWCERLGLRIDHFDTQESGFTVRAVAR